MKKSVYWSIRKLLAGEHPAQFARHIYKASQSGATVLFGIDDKTVVASDLVIDDEIKALRDFWLHTNFTGIGVCGYVEGSDVDLEPIWLSDSFTRDQFYEALNETDEEASFYWHRDNENNFIVEVDRESYWAKETWEGIKHDPELPKEALALFENWLTQDTRPIEIDKAIALSDTVSVTEWLDDSTWR